MTIKIYLKNRRKPFKIEFESKKGYERMLENLHDPVGIIVLGHLTFKTTEFCYSIVTK